MNRDRFPRIPAQATVSQLAAVSAALGASHKGAVLEITDGTAPGLYRWTGTKFLRAAGSGVVDLPVVNNLTAVDSLVYVEADGTLALASTSMQAELWRPMYIVGGDGQLYSPVGGQPIPLANPLPTNSQIVLQTPATAGASNLAAMPNPYPAPSTTYTQLVVGFVAKDPKILLPNIGTPIYQERSYLLGELFEYDFKAGTNSGVLEDKSGLGNNATISSGAFSSYGLTFTASTQVETSVAWPANFTIIAAFRPTATGPRVVVARPSGSGNPGPMWRLSDVDQAVWTDATKPSYNFSQAAAIAGTNANKAYILEVNGTAITLYDGTGAVIGTGTAQQVSPGVSTIKIGGRAAAGAGDNFVGEFMYMRAFNRVLTPSERADAVAKMNAALAGRPT